ncbi:MAG TPA: ABC transporter substrate-binding protein [Microvirga sp.]|jgi:putative ABC transport system substrate-binding protein|nr:ABC transporter substrate-binding protein [Microvirga sp.]
MRRREAIAVLGGAMLAWPLGAQAHQHQAVVGFLRSTTSAGSEHLIAAFTRGLTEASYDGRTVAVSVRFADNRRDQLPVMAADLVRQGVAVIVANTPAAVAAKSATSTTPIVFVAGDDPVRLGLVSSLSRPGGNVTGINFDDVALTGKRLQLLCELVPDARLVGVILDPSVPGHGFEATEVETAARALGREIVVEKGTTGDEVERAFQTFTGRGAGAVLVGGGAAFNSMREKVIALAARHALPASYAQRAFAETGGLMIYGANLADMYRQAGIYAGRILKGERPADIPVNRPTEFELVLNLRTAKALRLTIPPTLLARADEVIE